MSRFLASLILAFAALAQSQPQNAPQNTTADAFVARMMAFDKNNDGKLTRSEISDQRLLPLFDQADANKDGVVTKDELIALYSVQQSSMSGDRGPGGRGGFGLDGGPGGRPGGRGMRPPEPGQVLNARMREALQLTDGQ